MRTKVARYCAAYINRPGSPSVLLQCATSTSGRIHGESCAFTSVPTGAPTGTLPTWGMPSQALRPSGNIMPPLGLRMLVPSPAMLTSRTFSPSPVGSPRREGDSSHPFPTSSLFVIFRVAFTRCNSGFL